ncbi:uncharacterized protein LOC115736623 isoform X2 [Rhodamnia argentea]|uniref:Uncharacterized protein LOC115736623 isoform X2 n=1 Tax=Rhodamnia argentea TaxID=178133 RepID=A0A8B8NP27_9MYRT|nr:uncharacterized protein LOC115736623 isoform X2 [Rhodamnia argentea]
MESCGRPNRSDVHLSKEEEAMVQEKTKEYFDGIAPKRHTKPQRSEYSSNYVDVLSTDGNIPEFTEFQRLENDPQKLVYNGSEAKDDFIETEYYKDLDGIDKQHHKTGTGFITMENTEGEGFTLDPETSTIHHASCKGNPATNEWIPAASDIVDDSSL